MRDDYDSNQPQKADKLHEKKREPHGCYGVCMDETYVHKRLENSGDKNRHCQRIYQRARYVTNVESKDNRAENRKIFDAVRVSPHRALIPFLPPSGISREFLDRYPSTEDAAPAINPDRKKQQKKPPCFELSNIHTGTVIAAPPKRT